VPPNKFDGRKTPIFADLRTLIPHFETRHSVMQEKSGPLQ